jgi:hypothetical protein
MDYFRTQAEIDFESARLHAFVREAASLVAHRPNELLSFDAVRRSLPMLGSSYLGVRTVPIAQIIGSATHRYNDFDRAFLPAQVRTRSRWTRIDAARLAGENLPPVQLYKLGELYFVRDGHHRVSVARQKGEEFVDAEVIEVRTRVPLTADQKELNGDELEAIGEYSNFLEQTQLDRLRPDADIHFSRPGGYARLLEHIIVHRYFMGLDFVRDVTWEEAVGDWYDYIYMPIVWIIRERQILKDFPQRTEADLYLWIMDHHHYLQERGEPDWDTAAEDFRQNYSPRLNRKLSRLLRSLITQWRGEHAHPAESKPEAVATDG